MAESKINAPYGIKKNLGSVIVIGQNDYVVPSDGYFVAICQNTPNNYCYGYVDGIHVMTASTSTSISDIGYPRTSVFVRKGTRISIGCNNYGSVLNRGEFYPLV